MGSRLEVPRSATRDAFLRPGRRGGFPNHRCQLKPSASCFVVCCRGGSVTHPLGFAVQRAGLKPECGRVANPPLRRPRSGSQPPVPGRRSVDRFVELRYRNSD